MESAVTPSPVAARVAERYARVPSFREQLSDPAVQSRSASTVPPPEKPPASRAAHQAEHQAETGTPPERSHSASLFPDGGPPPSRPYQPDLLRYSVSPDSLPPPRTTPVQARAEAASASRAAVAEAVDPEEMADPLEEAVVEPTRLLPARILQFPRELIAPRKARPRAAEGPLRQETARQEPPVLEATLPVAQAAPADANEAAMEAAMEAALEAVVEAPASAAIVSEPASEPGSIDTAFLDSLIHAPEPHTEPRAPQTPAHTAQAVAPAAEPIPEPVAEPISAPAPEWHTIQLDDEPAVRRENQPRSSLLDEMPLHVAPFGDRLMSGVVDLALTLAAFLVFVLVFAACSTHMPTGKAAAAGACVVLLAIFVLYQLIFFRLSGATLGMRYARISLCTFDDENPAPSAVRTRIAALLLSGLPLGIGFLWAVFDEDFLGWHDRITRTYQRSYREM